MTTRRNLTTTTRAAAALLASAGMLWPTGASAQSEDEATDPSLAEASEPPAPAPTTAPAPASSAPAPGPMPPLASPVYPARYPEAFQPKALPAEPEGPVFSWEPLRFAVAFETRTTWLDDDGAKRLVDLKQPSAVGVSLQAEVLRPVADLAVRLDLGWLTSSSSSYQNGSSLQQKLDSNLFSLGLALSYQSLRWLAPFGRVSGGLGWDQLRVADLHDRQFYAQGTVGAGVIIRGPGLRLWPGARAPFLGVAGQLEGGYLLAADGEFVLHADRPTSSDKPIPTSEVRLGRMDRNAPYLRVALALAF